MGDNTFPEGFIIVITRLGETGNQILGGLSLMAFCRNINFSSLGMAV